MGCGATRVSPEHHWRPPAPKVLAVPAKQGSQRVISRHGVVRQEMVRGSQPCVAPVCDFTSLGECQNAEAPRSSSTRTSNGFSHSISNRSSSQVQPLRSGSLREHQEKLLQARIPMVVDGSDLVDLDAQDLLDVLSSWEGQRPPVPPGMRVACAPDRRKHEAQLKNLSRYREEVEQHPETVAEEVEIKRLEHEQWLDYREISEGFSGGRLDG